MVRQLVTRLPVSLPPTFLVPLQRLPNIRFYDGGLLMSHLSALCAASLGVAVTLYGTIQHDGANFSFIVNGAPPQLCTSRQNGSDVFGSELCSIGNLDGTGQHTLTIQHTDPSGGWLAIDYLE